MRILLDENVHAQVADVLREAGHEVVSIAWSHPGISDKKLLSRKDIGDCLLVTYDRDFGELVFKEGLAAPLGIIYSRLGRSDPDVLAHRILALIAADDVASKFIVVEKDGERVKALPEQRQD